MFNPYERWRANWVEKTRSVAGENLKSTTNPLKMKKVTDTNL